MNVLSVRHLIKKINKKEIIKGVSFDIQNGEVFGFLGPNGAGKTTTIRMLVGLIRPTSGTVHICGHEVQTNFVQAMRCIGCIVENPELYSFLTGRENLLHFSRMLGPTDGERIREVIRLVEMENRIDDRVKTYSLGMRQRLGIAQALLGKPKLLVLDEPTNGLDPSGIKELRALIHRLTHEEDISVLVSSHLLGEVQMMCDRVAIISHGSIIRTDSVEALINTDAGNVEWRLRPLEKGLEALKREAYETTVKDEETVICHMPFSEIEELNQILVKQDIYICGIRKKEKSLEDLFLALTGGDRIE